MKAIYSLISMLAISLAWNVQIYAQTCATEFESHAQELQHRKSSLQSSDYLVEGRSVRDYALNVVLFQYQDGPISQLNTIMEVIDSLNNVFASINVHFSICAINTVPYPYHLDPVQVGFETLPQPVIDFIANNYFRTNMINVAYARGVVPHSFYPNSTYPYPRIVLNNSGGYLVNPHEFGHFFGLRHTHQFDFHFPGMITDELVNGSNCATAGDLVCDTPADPGLMPWLVSPFPACQWLDTVTVDANGELFNPLTNNYMSYMGLCTESFTSGQYARMAYFADHDRANLKSGGKNFNLNPIPMKVCLDGGPINLIAPDTGIVFSGAGVIDNMFYPDIAGVGNHIINLTLPGQSNNDENTDVCFVYHDTAYSATQVWQSFTMESDGQLTGVSLGVQSVNSQSGTFSLYLGAGTGGTLMAQGNLSINGSIGWNWLRANFNNLPVTAGQSYTIEFNFNGTVLFEGCGFDAYAGGGNNINGDVIFLTHIIPNAPYCGNTFSFPIYVSAGDSIIPHSIIPQELCASADPILLEAFPFNSVFYIDNQAMSVFDASQLGEGVHTMVITHTNPIGCIRTITDTFTVIPAANLNIIDGSVFCESDSGISVVTNLPNADIYLNGNLLNGSFVDFSTLGLGQHEIGYAHPRVYEGIELDQSHYPITGATATWGMSSSGVRYQTFTAQKTGFLEKVILAIRINGQAHQMNVRVRKGNYIQASGTNVIYSTQVNVGGHDLDFHQFQFPPNTIPVYTDSLYSFELHYSGLQAGQLYGSFGNTYPGGNNGNPNSDFYFKTYVRIPNYQCDADSVLRTFEIVPNLSVNLGNDTVLVSGESIILNAGNPGNQYLWSTGETTQTITLTAPLTDPEVWVMVSSSSGCEATDTIQISLITRVDEQAIRPSLAVYPNPGSDFITLESNQMILEYQIINVLGQMVERRTVNNNLARFSVEEFSSGIYFVRIQTAKGDAISRWHKK
jgi:hypothetical protein